MVYVIKDLNTNEYYRQKPGPKGWYSSNINHARLYSTEKIAQKTIDIGNHHVSYPGNRNLTIIEVILIELNSSKKEK